MENKKKYRGGLKLLLLPLFIMLLGIFSTCYADISNEYIDYGINYLKNNYSINYYTQDVRTRLGTITSKDKLAIKNNFNNFLAQNGLSSTTDRNYFITAKYEGGTYITVLKIFCFNNTVPNGNDNLANFLFNSRSINAYQPTSNDKWLQMNVRKNGSTLNFDYFVNPSSSSVDFGNYTLDSANNVIKILNCVCCGLPGGFINIPFTGSSNPTSYIVQDYNGNYQPPTSGPEEPSGESSTSGTGTITNNSGDTTGKIDLSGIEQGIGNIQNQISGDTKKVIENQNQNTQTIVNALSGETEKITNTLTDSADDLIDNTIITSGDIESALNFEIAQDPYSNFWFTLTNNLKSALLGTKRSIDISFQGRTWTISLDEYMVLPAWLVIILTPFSTAFFTWVLVRQFKLIFDKLASGNVDSLLKENSEERYL